MKNKKTAKIDRSHINVRLSLTNRHGVVRMYHKGTAARFISRLRASWKQGFNDFNILVTYGIEKDVFGDVVMFKNEYRGTSYKEADEALRAFLEV